MTFTVGPVTLALRHIIALRIEGQEGMGGKLNVAVYTPARTPLQLLLTKTQHDELVAAMAAAGGAQ
ncbi:MAG: hypothetical protein IPH07_24250 [Deltaproteobacteria bacterium]|nr:hypothetical protein [Deltaproteobacteria bacterium]